MKTAYSFIVLRYVHDVVTGEFINVGVALYAPSAKFLGGICNARYGRISKMFGEVDANYFRGLVRYIEERFWEFGDHLRKDLPLWVPANIEAIANGILPPDDSSLQWSAPGSGLTDDPAETLKVLYTRMVERYEGRQPRHTREDGEVWRVFRKELEPLQVLDKLQPKRIVARDYEYEFAHAWRNEQWRMLEPVSFDLVEAESILDKANRWLGRGLTLHESPEKFKLHLMLGEPSDEKLMTAYLKAKNILNKMPGDKEFVGEHEAQEFAESIAAEIAAHDGNE